MGTVAVESSTAAVREAAVELVARLERASEAVA
jgi:hypothetical protein